MDMRNWQYDGLFVFYSLKLFFVSEKKKKKLVLKVIFRSGTSSFLKLKENLNILRFFSTLCFQTYIYSYSFLHYPIFFPHALYYLKSRFTKLF